MKRRAETVVIRYAESLGLTVTLDRQPGAHIRGRDIRVSGRVREQTRVFWLLHELGHYIADRFPHPVKSHVDSIDKLECEIEAWDVGLDIAQKLKLNIDHEAFFKERAACLMTHVRWVCHGRRRKQNRLGSAVAYSSQQIGNRGPDNVRPRSVGLSQTLASRGGFEDSKEVPQDLAISEA